MNSKNNQIDKSIVKELFNLNLNIQKSFDDVCLDIENKRNNDYCGAYELIKHDKLKNECFKTKNKDNNANNSKQGKLDSIQSILGRTKLEGEEVKNQPQDLTMGKSHQQVSDSKVVFSQSHIQRLNRINNKFKRNDLFMNHRQDNNELNSS